MLAGVKMGSLRPNSTNSSNREAVRQRKPLRRVWDGILAYLAGIVFFGLGGVLFSVLCGFLRLILPASRGQKFGRLAIWNLCRFHAWFWNFARLVPVDMSELKALREQRGVIVAPNHPCIIDAILIMSQLPDAVCVIKASLWNNPILGGARLAGYIRNDSRSRLIRRSIASLKDGAQLLVFPEGTRTVVDPINDFKPGFALMAREAGVPVQTVFIETETLALRKGWPVLKKPDFPMRFRIRLGERFEPNPDEDLRDWVSKLEDYYRDELRRS